MPVLASLQDNLEEGRWAPAASYALADMIAAMVLEAHGVSVPGSHRGRLHALARVDQELARVYGRLQELYSRMSYLGLDGGLAKEVEEPVKNLLEGLERHGLWLGC